MPLSNPNYDRQLTRAEAEVIVRHLSNGRILIREKDGEIMLCEEGATLGFRLLPYQMTTRGVMHAVSEIYPHIEPPQT